MIADFINTILGRLSNKSVSNDKEANMAVVKSASPSFGSSLGSFGEQYESGTSFKIFSANGGTIIQTYHHDPVRDRRHSQLYIVPSGESLGKEIELILTKEGLSR